MIKTLCTNSMHDIQCDLTSDFIYKLTNKIWREITETLFQCTYNKTDTVKFAVNMLVKLKMQIK